MLSKIDFRAKRGVRGYIPANDIENLEQIWSRLLFHDRLHKTIMEQIIGLYYRYSVISGGL